MKAAFNIETDVYLSVLMSLIKGLFLKIHNFKFLVDVSLAVNIRITIFVIVISAHI